MATIGAFIFVLAQVYFLLAAALPVYFGKHTKQGSAGTSPWQGERGLERAVPAPYHTFETPPVVEW